VSARTLSRAALAAGLAAMLATTGLSAQRGGGGAPGGGRAAQAATRLDILTAAFSLQDEQKKQVKSILDDGYKAAEPLRDALTKTRAVLAKAVQNEKDQAAIDAATTAYAKNATAMAQAEVKAVAEVLKALTPQQRGNQTAVQSFVYVSRGMFYGKKWDMAPDVRFY